MEILDDGAWIAAVAVPWTIAPHPNFSQENVSGPGLLALIAQFRASDLERYKSLLSEGDNSRLLHFVESAKRSTYVGTVRSGADDLWNLAATDQESLGLRVAAALFAAVAEVELDEIRVAVQKLTSLACALSGVSNTRSSRLALALLHQQIAARNFELYEYPAAIKSLDMLPGLLINDGEWDVFSVSLGISWDAERVQEDIQEAIHAHSLELRARMEGFDGTTWVDVVKSRSNWPDYRSALPSATRDRAFVEHKFDSSIGVRSQGRTWTSSDPVISPGLETLLVAELSGDVNAYMLNREVLAKHRILRVSEKSTNDDVWFVQDALRLLRQSRSKKSLKRALDWIYLQGPNKALIHDATLILERNGFPSDVSYLDLMVVSSAAPYLSQELLEKGVDSALHLLGNRPSDPRSSLEEERSVWQSLLKLLPNSGRDNEIAAAALETLDKPASLQIIEGEILRLVDILAWDSVDQKYIDKWTQWGNRNSKNVSHAELVRRLMHIGKPVDHLLVLKTISDNDLPFYLVSNYDELDSVSEDYLIRAELELVADLNKIREEAKNGSASFGGVDLVDLSVVYANLFERSNVWVAIAELLTDPSVSREKKQRSLARIAKYGLAKVPESFRLRIVENWSGVFDSKAMGVFLEPDPDARFTEAIHAGAVLQALSRDEALAAATELAGSRSPDERMAACSILPDVARAHSEWEWAQTLLLHLTRDLDAMVRSNSSRALAIVGIKKTGISSLVKSSLVNSLQSGGIRTPLLAIHGFQYLAEAGELVHYGDEIVSLIRGMSISHEARTIREAAQHVIKFVD